LNIFLLLLLLLLLLLRLLLLLLLRASVRLFTPKVSHALISVECLLSTTLLPGAKAKAAKSAAEAGMKGVELVRGTGIMSSMQKRDWNGCDDLGNEQLRSQAKRQGGH
jgi:hypothetical protein